MTRFWFSVSQIFVLTWVDVCFSYSVKALLDSGSLKALDVSNLQVQKPTHPEFAPTEPDGPKL